MNEKIETAVITGEHPYDVVGFQSMLRSFPEIETYPQNMYEFFVDPALGPGNNEVLLFYNMHLRTPAEEDGGFEAAMKKTICHEN